MQYTTFSHWLLSPSNKYLMSFHDLTVGRSNRSNPKEVSPEYSLGGRTDDDAEALILWPPNVKN